MSAPLPLSLQDSLTLSSRQRYVLKHRQKGQTSIYIRGVDKEVLLTKDKYTAYIRSLVSAGMHSNGVSFSHLFQHLPTCMCENACLGGFPGMCN